VKVMVVDVDRQRIGLSLRLNDDPQGDQGKRPERSSGPRRDQGAGERRKPAAAKNSGPREAKPAAGSMAEALRKAGFGK
jgi:uncharacterized protein